MPTRGNPYAIVRLEPEVMEALKHRVRPRKRGKGGGVSQYLRELVYEPLGLGEASCFGYGSEAPVPPPRRREPPAAPELI